MPPPPPGFVMENTQSPDPSANQAGHDNLALPTHLAEGEIALQEKGQKLLPDGDGNYSMHQVSAPRQLSLSEKTAIHDAYRKQYAFLPNPSTPRNEAGLEGQRSTYQINDAAIKGNSFAQNASAAYGQTMANVGTGLIGTVAPGTANDLQQNVNANLVAEPGSAGQFVGGVAGQLVLAAPSIVAPGLAARGFLPQASANAVGHLTAGTFGAQAFGQIRQEVAQRRQAGQNISTQDELTAAALSAVNTFAASKVSQKAMTKVGQQFSPEIQKTLAGVVSAYVVNTGIQATDQMVMTAVQNAIKEHTIAPDMSGSEMFGGIAEAGATGGIIGAVGGLASAKTHAGPGETTPAGDKLAEAAKAAAPSPETLKDLKTGTLNDVPQEPQGSPAVGVANPEAPVAGATVGAPSGGDSAVQPQVKSLPQNLESHEPIVRRNNGAKSAAIPLSFESPRDKALYVNGYARKGKLSADAAGYLGEVKPGEVEGVQKRVNDLADKYVQFPEGDSIHVPSAEAKAEFTPAPAEQDVNDTEHLTAAKSEAKKLIKGFKEQAPADRNQAKVRDAFKTLGRDVVYYDGEGRGVRIHGHDNVLFINRKNVAGDLHEAVSHEFWHDVQTAHPDLAKAVSDAIEPAVLEQAKQEYAKKYEAMRPGEKLDAPTLQREAEALVLGDAARRGRVFRALTGEKATVWDRVKDVFSKFADKLRGKSKLVDTALDGFLKARDAAQESRHAPEADKGAEFLPDHTPRIRDEAEEYTKAHGLTYAPDHTYAKVDEARAKNIADWYDKAQHNPNDPQVKASYDAMKKETLDQWNFLERKGVKFEPWQGEGQPYKNSDEVIKDIRDNNHLAFFTGGDMPGDHPLGEKTGIVKNGQELSYNDVFRAVHDYFGHGKEGVGFGPRGEENAWRSHSQMYSETARPAMTAETRGQNSWVNFGPFGEQNRAKPAETKYADQKALVAPPEFTKAQRDNGAEFLPPAGTKKREKALEGIESTSLRERPLNAGKNLFGDSKAPSTKIEEVARILNERTKKLAGESKARETEKLERAVAAGIPEAEYQLKQPDSGKDWYKADIAKMEATMTKLYPELEQPENMTIFKSILAITSQGNNPNVNLKHAEGIYRHYSETGEILKQQPNGKNWPGTLGENYKLPLGRLEGLIKQEGVDGAAKWLLSKHSVADINAFSESLGLNANVSGPKGEQVYGMEIFGPKIGVFALNQHGIQEKITKDMWFSRTWNRWMGTMMEGGEIVDAPRNDAEREVMDKAVNVLAGKLKMDPSEVQAVLWYYEQQLWKNHGAKVESGSYSKAAEKVFNGDSYDPERASDGGAGGEAAGKGSDANPGLFHAADGGERSGGGKAEFYPGERFVEDDLKPKLKSAAEGVGKAWAGVKSIVAPFTRGPQGETAKGIMRERGAELQQRFDRLSDAFKESEKLMEGMNKTQTRTFIDDVENGRAQTDPALQPIADAVRGILDDRLTQVQALGTGKLTDFIKNYFPHIWQDPTKAASVYAEVMAKAPLQGGKKFLKQRSIKLMSDGFAQGLQPVTENPITSMMLRVREMDKYITAQDMFKEMLGKGMLQNIKARDQVPAGYAKIDDNIATIYAKSSRRGAIQTQGYYVAPEAVANVVNNYLSPGIRGHKLFGPAFRGFLGAGNMMNSVQLGLSGFHLAFTTMDSMISKAALSIEQAAAGDWKNAAKSAAITGTVFGPVIENVRKGNKVMQEWYHPGTTTPDIAAIVDAMKAAGGRVKMDDFYRTNVTDKMVEALKHGNVVGAALRLPFSLLELTGKPILEHLVPRVKLGAFMDMAQHEMSQNSGMTRDELRSAMGKTWDSVDNRLGEMVYDNLFWNKSFKDLAMASVRSVGWNLGTFRELGGGLMDTGKAVGLLARGKKAELTHRMAYTVAMPIVTGLVGGMIHYLLNGKKPEELKDYFFPRTGRQDKEGHDIRLTLPSYMKDVLAYGKDVKTAVTEKKPVAALQTISHKVHPMLNTIMEMLSNKDYYGTKIYNEDDSLVKNLVDVVKHGAEAAEPFGVREVVKLAKQGQGAKSLLPLIGVTTARKDITSTDAENKAAELLRDRMPQGSRTQEEADKSALIRDIADRIRAKDSSGRTDLAKAVKDGSFTEADIENVKNHIRYHGLDRAVRSMEFMDSMEVWKVATPEERRHLGPLMFEKLRSSKALTRQQRIDSLRTLQSDWKALRAGVSP